MYKEPLKYIWRNLGVRNIYLDIEFNSLLKEWRINRNAQAWARSASDPVVLLIPSDPKLLLASKGDEAMLTAITTHFRKKWPNVKFVIATAGDEADECARKLGAEPLRLLDKKLSLYQITESIKAHNVCASITVGADVLDGAYSPAFSGKLLMLTDMLARRGVTCAVTGFSVSKTPYKRLNLVLDEFCDSVVFNLRDPVSFERFKKLTKANANLVADVAFLLEPKTETEIVKETKIWIDDQRAKERKIIGLNLHPLLLELKERHNIDHVTKKFSSTIQYLIKNNGISVILLEHDFRGSSSDYHCLNLVEERLKSEVGEFVFRPKFQLSAAELKGIAGYVDGVISGRMHLMIASCGAGTPVFGIDYKAKMEGLMEHFGLGTSYLSNAHEIINAQDKFKSKLTDFIENISSIKQQLLKNIPEIKNLSSKNFLN